MNAERVTDDLIGRLLPAHPTSGGCGFVEVGLGSVDWSFDWAAKRGFRCLAFEPAPVEALVLACQKAGVVLERVAVGRQCEEATLYRGEVDGHPLPDTNSLREDWWGTGAQTTRVQVVTLPMALAKFQLEDLACLKVDVEGSEADVLSGLPDLPQSLLPEVLVFEYGGGGTRGENAGGWSERGLASTKECIELAGRLGYRWGVLCERSEDRPLELTFPITGDQFVMLFSDRARVGNVLVARCAKPEWLSPWLDRCAWLSRVDRVVAPCRSLLGTFRAIRIRLRARVFREPSSMQSRSRR